MTTQNASRIFAGSKPQPRLAQPGLVQLGPVLKIEKVSNENPTVARSWSKGIRLSAMLAARLLRATLRLLVAIVTSSLSAGLKRRVAPGRRSEERYEFESTAMRAGTWGRIY